MSDKNRIIIAPNRPSIWRFPSVNVLPRGNEFFDHIRVSVETSYAQWGVTTCADFIVIESAVPERKYRISKCNKKNEEEHT